MSALREYLEREAENEKGWLRRTPRATHPDVQQLYAEFVGTGAYPYLDSVSRFITERTPDLPPFDTHKPGNEQPNRLQRQLSHEVYVAAGVHRDAGRAARLEQLKGEGFAPLDPADVKPGAVYLLARGTFYSGADVVELAEPVKVRPVFEAGELRGFLPPRKRSHGFPVSSSDYVKVTA